MPRRAQTRTPPKPARDIFAKATKSVSKSGGDLERSGAGAAADDESGGMASFKGARSLGQPTLPAYPPRKDSGFLKTMCFNGFFGSVFLNLCALYWGCRFAGYGNKLPSQ